MMKVGGTEYRVDWYFKTQTFSSTDSVSWYEKEDKHPETRWSKTELTKYSQVPGHADLSHQFSATDAPETFNPNHPRVKVLTLQWSTFGNLGRGKRVEGRGSDFAAAVAGCFRRRRRQNFGTRAVVRKGAQLKPNYRVLRL